MCINIRVQDVRDYSLQDVLTKPFSLRLLGKTLEFRNGVEFPRYWGRDENRVVQEAYNNLGPFESFARKIVGELLFAAVAVAFIVECTARTLLSLLGAALLLPCEYCFPGGFEAAIASAGENFGYIFYGPSACFAGFVTSPCMSEFMHPRDLNFC